MTDQQQPPTHEALEQHVQVLDAYYQMLPDGKDKDSARHHLELSEAAAHRSREAYRPEPAEAGE